MQPEKNSRWDTHELKAQLLNKVGQESFKRYFHCLNRFINQKLSKSEFDKSCYRILGRENLPLHNQMLKAILKNACSAKTTPPKAHEVGPATETGTTAKRCSPVLEDGLGQGAGVAHHQSSVTPVWSNGVVPMSSRKGRSVIRDRKLRDRPSPLGPNGKADSASLQSTAIDDVCAMSLENGDLAPCDYPRLVIKKPADVSGVVRDNSQGKAATVEDAEVVEHAGQLKFSRSPLIAPLGIPYCSASTGGARKVLPVTYVGDYVSCFDLDGLSDSETVRRRMEQIAAPQGLGVTLECANTLNNMVDVYLKRLISSCLELVDSRSTSDTSTYPVLKQQLPGKPINGLWPTNHINMQNSGGGVEAQRFHQSVSLFDFKVAVELNPQQLGENWPFLLEKISMQGFEE